MNDMNNRSYNFYFYHDFLENRYQEKELVDIILKFYKLYQIYSKLKLLSEI
ncbi:hypothetical protein pb186bvf_021020 [Paramecium bursaria]